MQGSECPGLSTSSSTCEAGIPPKDYLNDSIIMIEVESNTKAAHLKKLDHAPKNLQLFRAKCLAYVSLGVANAGYAGVFHVAGPFPPSSVPNPEIDLIEPTVTGTLNVPKAFTEAHVRQVIVVSSPFVVPMPTAWPKDTIMDET
ncbi:putative anthocyanidin reductase [Aristolochia californica]|uniref:putative anthocyanidin reductase n=1 Tax=Aristolochia californica TaxID=171875 RepID=UPI0035E296BF